LRNASKYQYTLGNPRVAFLLVKSDTPTILIPKQVKHHNLILSTSQILQESLNQVLKRKATLSRYLKSDISNTPITAITDPIDDTVLYEAMDILLQYTTPPMEILPICGSNVLEMLGVVTAILDEIEIDEKIVNMKISLEGVKTTPNSIMQSLNNLLRRVLPFGKLING
jgi:hypothetical protein